MGTSSESATREEAFTSVQNAAMDSAEDAPFVAVENRYGTPD